MVSVETTRSVTITVSTRVFAIGAILLFGGL